MSEKDRETMLAAFMADPGPETAFALIAACRSYIVNAAGSWREPNLSREDKIRELMSEILLILLEDFNGSRAVHPRSGLAFIHKKLKRLTMPARRKEILISGDDGLAELGRVNFSPLRLELVEEIFQAVRRCLLGCHDEKVAQLSFLFVHVFPEVAWASRLLAQREGADQQTRFEADKKRLARFNHHLKLEFKTLRNGDWQEVTTWSRGERSHLAWRIISIAPGEIEPGTETDLSRLDAWREHIDRRQPQSQEDLERALNVYSAMRRRFGQSGPSFVAAEEAEIWGDPPDILTRLIGAPFDGIVSTVAESPDEWEASDNQKSGAADDPEYAKIAAELNPWFIELLNEKRKNKEKTAQKVLRYT